MATWALPLPPLPPALCHHWGEGCHTRWPTHACSGWGLSVGSGRERPDTLQTCSNLVPLGWVVVDNQRGVSTSTPIGRESWVGLGGSLETGLPPWLHVGLTSEPTLLLARFGVRLH